MPLTLNNTRTAFSKYKERDELDKIYFPKSEALLLTAVKQSNLGEESIVYDSSENLTHGNASGTVTIINDTEVGKCFDFENGKFEFNPVSFSKTLSVSFLYKRTGNSNNYGALFVSNDGEYAYLEIETLNSNSLRFRIYNKVSTSDKSIISTNEIPLNEWHRYTCVVDFAGLKFSVYIDGNLFLSNNLIENSFSDIPSSGAITKLRIGRLQSNGYPAVNCLLADYRVYNYALNEKQIKALNKYSNNFENYVAHSHGNITNDGKLGTASRPVVTDSNKNITTGSFGTTAGTFCEGNDSRLSDARTPISHNQTSNTINAMTGYSKADAVADIATTDTLNQAIGKVEYVATSANTKIDNLQVGGRNLLLKDSTWTVYNPATQGNITEQNGNLKLKFTNIVSSNSIDLSNNKARKIANRKETISFYLKVDDNIPQTAPFHFWPILYLNRKETYDNTTGRFTVSYTSSDTRGYIIQVVFDIDTSSVHTFELTNIKFEEGNQATTWTPAPEDTDSLIATAQGKADSAYSNNQATQTQLDNLQVGGRNLLLNSDNNGNGWNNADYPTCAIPFGNEKPISGNTLTVSFKATIDWTKISRITAYLDSNTSVANIYEANLDANGNYIKTFTLSSTINNPTFRLYTFLKSGVSTRPTTTIEWVKLEFGNQATTWTPAPEDVDADISTANALANELDSLQMPTGEILWLSAKGCTTSSIAQTNGVIDVSGNGNNGQAYNGVQVVQDSEMGACYSFDYSEANYLLINESNFIDKLNLVSEFTLYIRARYTGNTNKSNYYGRVGGMTSQNGLLHGFIVLNPNTGKWEFDDLLNSSDTPKYVELPISNLLDWHTYTVTVNYTSGVMTMFLDSVQVAQNTNWYTGSHKTGVKYVQIGRNDSSKYFQGDISDFRIYPYALTASQVKALHKYGQQGQDTSGIQALQKINSETATLSNQDIADIIAEVTE